MLAYVTLGTNDLARGAGFYDLLAAELGMGRIMEDPGRFIAWGAPGVPGIGLIVPFDEAPATVGNGSMVSLAARDRNQVDRLHAIALKAGGKDEGAPGVRNGRFYLAYFRDLDGNKLNAFTTG